MTEQANVGRFVGRHRRTKEDRRFIAGLGRYVADIRLPDMNGYELLLKLKEILEDVPLVLMSGFGYDPGHCIIKARAEGVQHVLYKPFRLDQLLSAVQDTIRPGSH